MFNDIPIGPVTIHMYGLMIALGFLSAYYLCVYRGRRRGLSEDILWGILCCAIVGGLIGTRLLYYIVEFPSILKDPSILWDVKNGYVGYGGIIGGVLAGFWYCRKKKVSFLKYFDLVMPAVALAQGLGRLGCFFAGCCYGRQTDAWYGITFHNSKFAPNNVKLVPTQLISSAGDFVICGILLFYASKNPRDGRVASAYLMLYGIGRFIVEFWRNDYRGSIGWMSTSQIISVGIVAVGILLYILLPRFTVGKASVEQETK
ncbi:MAG: prolipoprotein diacylglyceryl transferase [Lachnospiraceae bacterium]|nr:prolipoprotein diacylglyceryl transferase [Lachnospiraceae bacterium]